MPAEFIALTFSKNLRAKNLIGFICRKFYDLSISNYSPSLWGTLKTEALIHYLTEIRKKVYLIYFMQFRLSNCFSTHVFESNNFFFQLNALVFLPTTKEYWVYLCRFCIWYNQRLKVKWAYFIWVQKLQSIILWLQSQKTYFLQG